jgi:hypothetical protein
MVTTSRAEMEWKSSDCTNVVHFHRINVMKTAPAKSHRSSKSGRFVIEKKGSALFINGNRILDPAGKPSVEHSRLRAAVNIVASKR